MKNWQETRRIVDRLRVLAREGRPAALATVVAIKGSAYRRPGAKLLIEAGGATIGGVSGGCLEGDIREVGLAALRANTPRRLHYDTGTDADTVWGLGLGCEGMVDLFVQPATLGPVTDVLEPLARGLAGDQALVMITIIDAPEAVGRVLLLTRDGSLTGSSGERALDESLRARAVELLAAGQSAVLELGHTRIFADVLLPPPHLVVCGGGFDAVPLAAYAIDAGFRVTVVDHRPAHLAPTDYPADAHLVQRRSDDGLAGLPAGPDVFVVVKNHSLAHDRGWVSAFRPADVAYIGVLGPRARVERILEELAAAPVASRLYGPVGLDLGAEGPEQIALSIVAELLAVRAGRTPDHLRDKQGAIHAG